MVRPDDVKKFRCSGLEPTTFSQRNSSTHGEVPFKFMNRNSLVALEGYTRAFHAGKVDEPPAYLIKVRLNEDDASNHFMNEEDLRVYNGTKTLAFTKTVTGANYPTLQLDGVRVPIDVVEEAFNEMFARLFPGLEKRKREE